MARTLSASSRDRLLVAAAAEFAARGFDGATVDRIAARARVNKAMIYYHFRSKASLYREILRDVFAGVADRAEAVRDAGGTAERQLQALIEAVAAGAVAQPHFPPIWLREMAEDGRHVDRAIANQLRRVLGVLQGILDDGRRAGEFRSANVMVIHIGIVAPLLLFAASRPVRERFAALTPDHGDVTPEAVIQHVQAATLAVLAVDRTTRRRRPPKRRPRS